MSQVSLVNSKQVFAVFSKTQQSSNSLTQSSFCIKVRQIWNRICEFFQNIFCCKSRNHETKKSLIASSQSAVAKPSITSSQSVKKKPQEGKPVTHNPMIASSQSSVAKPSITSSQSAEKKAQEGKPL